MSSRLIAVVLLFLNSQLIFVSGANPMGIKGAQEAFFVFLILLSVGYLVSRSKDGNLLKVDVWVFIIVCIYVLMSTLIAWIRFGQPFLYGLIESRITFAMLIYFPMRYFISTGKLEVSNVFNLILSITVLIIFLSMLIKWGAIPKSILPSAPDEPMSGLRADRNSMGRYYIIFSFLYSYVMFVHMRKWSWFLLTGLMGYSVLFIIQERQLMFGLMFVVLCHLSYRLYKGDVRPLLYMCVGASLGGGILFFVLAEKANFLSALLLQTMSGETLETARFRTAAIMIGQLYNSNGMGFGALSLLWNNGFQRFYGEGFYLGDVGLLGTCFRFGLFAVPILLLVGMVIYRQIRKMKGGIAKEVIVLSFLYCIITLPTSAPIEYRGYFVGLLLAVVVSMNRRVGLYRRYYLGSLFAMRTASIAKA